MSGQEAVNDDVSPDPLSSSSQNASPSAVSNASLSFQPISLPSLKGQEKQDAYARLICKRIDDSLAGMNQRIEDTKQWRDAYDGIIYPVDRDEDAFGDRAEVWVPLTRSMVDTYHARVYRVIVAPQPLFDADANTAGGPGSVSPDAIRRIQQAADYDFRVHMKLEDVLDEALLHACIDGNAIIREDYVREYAPVRRPMVVTPELRQVVQGLDGYEDGATVLVEVPDPDNRTRDCPRLTVVPMKHFVLWPHDHPDIDSAPMKAERLILTRNELLIGADNGLYNDKAVKRLLEIADPMDLADDSRGGDSDLMLNVGFEPSDVEKPAPEALSPSVASDDLGTRYEVWMVTAQYPVDGKDKPARDCLFFVEKSKQILLAGGIFPHEVPSGECWYTNVAPLKNKDTWVGYAIPEVLRDIQDMMVDTFNQNLDAGAISNLIMFRKSPGAKINFGGQRWYQADIVECGPNDLSLLDFPRNAGNGARIDMAALQSMAEQVLGLSPYQQGQPGPSEKTLGEIQAVVTEGNERLNIPIGRVRRAFDRLANQWFLLRYQYMDRDLMYRIAGVQGGQQYDVLTISDLETKARLSLRSKPELADPRLAIQRAEKLAMFAANNPLMQSAESLYNTSAEVLKSLGFPNFTDFLGSKEDALKKEQAAQLQPPPLPPDVSVNPDEITNLALLLRSLDPAYKEMPFTDILEIAAEISRIMQKTSLPPVVGSRVGDAPDNAPGAATARTTGTGKIEPVGTNSYNPSTSGGSR